MNSLASSKSQSWLSWFLRGILIVLFLILFSKLFEVQIIKGGYYRDLSDQNRIRRIPIPAPRGRILARDGQVLAGNTEVKKRIQFSSDGSFKITEDLTNAAPEEIITDYKRVYPLGAKFGHGSGYLAEVDQSQVGTINPDCPEKGIRVSGMLVGKTGLEEEYECQLLGTPGEELIEVNTAGHKIRTLGRRDPVAGADVKTTIDFNLQQETANDMGSKPGAAVITDTEGAILAFYSSPSFDPNLLIKGSPADQKNNQEKIQELLTDPNLPFFDRAVSGTFHPGSVFKPLVAIAALEQGVIDKNFEYNDPGVITINGFSYSNWFYSEDGRTEGWINLTRAIARSTDTFFYEVGDMAGPDNIAKWADRFGLDKPTGIDIPGETYGLIPTPSWKERTKHEAWFTGNTYNMSIGQGDVAITPVEEASYISAIAANGNLCQPHFVNDKSQMTNGKCKHIDIKQQNLDLVKEGMKEACQNGGTAYTFFDFSDKHSGQTIACKTGTAEVGTDGTPHAWFVLFTPIEKPQIVSTIVFERGGQGSEVAGPVARKIMDFYFGNVSQTKNVSK